MMKIGFKMPVCTRQEIGCLVSVWLLAVGMIACKENPLREDVSVSADRRLEAAIADAKSLQDQLGERRENLFNSALDQAASVTCSAWRIQALKGREFDGFKFEQLLVNLLQGQEFVKPNKTVEGCYHANGQHFRGVRLAWVEVPAAQAYGGKTWSIKTKGSDWNCLQERYFKGICKSHYLRPIPNSQAARELEQKNFAVEIVRSVRRLSAYEGKFPGLELDASRALAFESILIKLKEDLEADAQDPDFAASKMQEYRNFLDGAVRAVEHAREDVAIEMFVQDAEISELLAEFGSSP